MSKPLSRTRMVETFTQWVVYAGLVAPWAVLLAWLARR
jgi:hypothetical protein